MYNRTENESIVGTDMIGMVKDTSEQISWKMYSLLLKKKQQIGS